MTYKKNSLFKNILSFNKSKMQSAVIEKRIRLMFVPFTCSHFSCIKKSYFMLLKNTTEY